jgi:glycine/D-amino acid oxidase-like deaminating enzyme
VLHDTLSARLDPMAACKALAGAITARGGRIVADAEEAGAVVWATGSAGLAALSGALGKQVGQGIKGQAAVLALDRRDLPQLYAEGLHIVPHVDGTVAIGSTTERLFESANDTDAQLDDVIVRARAAVPVLGDAAVIRRWAGLRPRARTRAPMLGAWPGRPGQYVANGGFKIGFGVAVEVARVMADLVLDGCDAIPDGFRIEDSL